MGDNLLDCYNPLYDVHLRQYFALPHMQKHLRDVGLLNPSNEEGVYEKQQQRVMELLLRNRERVLSQMADLHKKLNAAEKVEICRRIRSGLPIHIDDEDSAHAAAAARRCAGRSLSRPSRGRSRRNGHQRRRSTSVDDSNELIRRIESDYRSDNETGRNSRNIYNRLAASVYKYAYLHKMDDRTLANYKDSLRKQLAKLERFRELSFGLNSVARHQPLAQSAASWFFRRRSLRKSRDAEKSPREPRVSASEAPPTTRHGVSRARTPQREKKRDFAHAQRLPQLASPPASTQPAKATKHHPPMATVKPTIQQKQPMTKPKKAEENEEKLVRSQSEIHSEQESDPLRIATDAAGLAGIALGLSAAHSPSSSSAATVGEDADGEESVADSMQDQKAHDDEADRLSRLSMSDSLADADATSQERALIKSSIADGIEFDTTGTGVPFQSEFDGPQFDREIDEEAQKQLNRSESGASLRTLQQVSGVNEPEMTEASPQTKTNAETDHLTMTSASAENEPDDEQDYSRNHDEEEQMILKRNVDYEAEVNYEDRSKISIDYNDENPIQREYRSASIDEKPDMVATDKLLDESDYQNEPIPPSTLPASAERDQDQSQDFRFVETAHGRDIGYNYEPETQFKAEHELKTELEHEFKTKLEHELKTELEHELKTELEHELKTELEHEREDQVESRDKISDDSNRFEHQNRLEDYNENINSDDANEINESPAADKLKSVDESNAENVFVPRESVYITDEEDTMENTAENCEELQDYLKTTGSLQSSARLSTELVPNHQLLEDSEQEENEEKLLLENVMSEKAVYNEPEIDQNNQINKLTEETGFQHEKEQAQGTQHGQEQAQSLQHEQEQEHDTQYGQTHGSQHGHEQAQASQHGQEQAQALQYGQEQAQDIQHGQKQAQSTQHGQGEPEHGRLARALQSDLEIVDTDDLADSSVHTDGSAVLKHTLSHRFPTTPQNSLSHLEELDYDDSQDTNLAVHVRDSNSQEKRSFDVNQGDKQSKKSDKIGPEELEKKEESSNVEEPIQLEYFHPMESDEDRKNRTNWNEENRQKVYSENGTGRFEDPAYDNEASDYAKNGCDENRDTQENPITDVEAIDSTQPEKDLELAGHLEDRQLEFYQQPESKNESTKLLYAEKLLQNDEDLERESKSEIVTFDGETRHYSRRSSKHLSHDEEAALPYRQNEEYDNRLTNEDDYDNQKYGNTFTNVNEHGRDPGNERFETTVFDSQKEDRHLENSQLYSSDDHGEISDELISTQSLRLKDVSHANFEAARDRDQPELMEYDNQDTVDTNTTHHFVSNVHDGSDNENINSDDANEINESPDFEQRNSNYFESGAEEEESQKSHRNPDQRKDDWRADQEQQHQSSRVGSDQELSGVTIADWEDVNNNNAEYRNPEYRDPDYRNHEYCNPQEELAYSQNMDYSAVSSESQNRENIQNEELLSTTVNAMLPYSNGSVVRHLQEFFLTQPSIEITPASDCSGSMEHVNESADQHEAQHYGNDMPDTVQEPSTRQLSYEERVEDHQQNSTPQQISYSNGQRTFETFSQHNQIDYDSNGERFEEFGNSKIENKVNDYAYGNEQEVGNFVEEYRRRNENGNNSKNNGDYGSESDDEDDTDSVIIHGSQKSDDDGSQHTVKKSYSGQKNTISDYENAMANSFQDRD